MVPPTPDLPDADRPPSAPSLIGRSLVNMSWLLRLRWAAVSGQLVTVYIVATVFGVALPLAALISIIAVAAATNVGLVVWSRRERRRNEEDARRLRNVIKWVMLLDVLLLTALLYVSGGPSNPFSIFYLVHLTLAAIILRGRWAYVLGTLTLVCFVLLFFFHMPLEALGDLTQLAVLTVPEGDGEAAARLLYLQGIMVAFGTAAVVVVYFILHLSTEFARLESDLREARRRQAQGEKLQALATLAAGAAHELASPLSTIAVVARDLEIELGGGAQSTPAVEDTKLIRAEVDRCRAILEQLSAEAGQSSGEAPERMTPRDLLEQAIAAVADTDRIRLDPVESSEACILYVPPRAVVRAVSAVVKNAFDASTDDTNVVVRWRTKDDVLEVQVWDQGSGMDAATLARAGEPFFTTKEPGRGMGLGLFLARTIIERIGGTLNLESVPTTGTIATIALPLSSN